MQYTGERYIPATEQARDQSPLLYAQIRHEHWHRYALSLQFVTGKHVLDIASGEGYGSALLASRAAFVTGVDIAPEAVAYATRAYAGRENLSFIAGSCAAIPLPAASVDVVTSFETLEHHDQHEAMMREIKRVLKPGGLLIISSPNKAIFTDKLNYSSHYHIKELYYDELVGLLQSYFKQVTIHGQKVAAGSFVYLLSGTQPAQLPVYCYTEAGVNPQMEALPETLYFIALCSDEALSAELTPVSLYLDPATEFFQLAEQEIPDEVRARADAYETLKQRTLTLEALNTSLGEQLHERNETLNNIVKSRAWRVMQLFWRLRRGLTK